jgi:DNA-binding NarL/FixJ family response regulator
VTGARSVLGRVESALDAGEFGTARDLLDDALAQADDPALRQVLGTIHYLEDRFDDARTQWERAFRAFRARGELKAAARCACHLAELHYSLENQVAAHGWAQRGRRALGETGDCVELGYVELAVVACDLGDVEALETAARFALGLAERFEDLELEARALADLGFALVCRGRVDEGFTHLDEALAVLTSGRVRDAAVIGRSFCSLLSACDRVGDIRRCEEWVRTVEQQVLAPLDGRPVIMRTHCRVAYGSVLRSAGRWAEAETMIDWVLSAEGSSSVGHRIEAMANLAEVRLGQGRVEEAAAMLAPYEDRLPVSCALAQVHLAQGSPRLAMAVAERALEVLVGDVPRRSALLGVLVEAAIAADDLPAAEIGVGQLRELAVDQELRQVQVRARFAQGLLQAARQELDAATDTFRQALAMTVDDEHPLLTGRIHLAAAEIRASLGDATSAIAHLRSALAVFQRIGATSFADHAVSVSRGLGDVVMRSRPSIARLADLTARESEVLALLGTGATNAEIAARLYLSPKTIEHHVGRILAKLQVRSRAQAAAVAAAAVAVPDSP